MYTMVFKALDDTFTASWIPLLTCDLGIFPAQHFSTASIVARQLTRQQDLTFHFNLLHSRQDCSTCSRGLTAVMQGPHERVDTSLVHSMTMCHIVPKPATASLEEEHAMTCMMLPTKRTRKRNTDIHPWIHRQRQAKALPSARAPATRIKTYQNVTFGSIPHTWGL
jgi:hypothetical protein